MNRKTFTYTLALAGLMLLGLLSSQKARSSTGELEGVIQQTSGDWIQFIAKRKGYMSWFKRQNLGELYSISHPNGFPRTGTISLVDGMLTNLPTLKGALGPGKKFYMHNNRGWTQIFSLYNSPIMLEGEVLSVDHGNQSFTIRYILKNDLGGRNGGDGPIDTVLSLNYDNSMVFKHEGQSLSPQEAIQVGRHIRFYESRPQTVQAFTPEALDFKQPHRNWKGLIRKSWVQKGFYRGHRDGKVYFAEYRNGEWINSYKEDDGYFQNHMIDGHYMNSEGASARSGDRVVFVPYAQHQGVHDTYQSKSAFFRPQDEETVEGTIVAINGNEVTLEVVSCPTGWARDVDTSQVTVSLGANAAYQLNGQTGKTKSEALQVGHYVRIKKAWSGAVLSRDPDPSKMKLDESQNVLPYFVSTEETEIIRDDTLWHLPDTIFARENQIIELDPFVMHIPGLTDLQWEIDGQNIAGAQLVAYERRVRLSDDGKKLRLKAITEKGTRSTPPIVLQVRPDQRPLRAVGALIAGPHQVLLKFNKRVQKSPGPHSAENPNNYAFSENVTIDSVNLLANRQKAVLHLHELTPGNDYNLSISNIRDLAASPNTFPPNYSVPLQYRVHFRYFQLMPTSRTNRSAHLAEMRLIEDGQAYGPAAKASGVDGGTPVIDEDPSTYVSINRYDKVKLDFGVGKGHRPDSLKIWLEDCDRNLNSFKLKASLDGEQWYTLFEKTSGKLSPCDGPFAFALSDTASLGGILPRQKQVQSIQFPPLPDVMLSESPLRFPAVSSTSGLNVSVEVVRGPAVLGAGIMLNDTGTVVMRAVQAGSDAYYPATAVERSFQVSMQPTGLAETQGTEGFRFFPNPTDGTLKLQTSQPGRLRIFDPSGRLQAQSRLRSGRQSLNLELSPGLYLLRFHSQSGKTLQGKLLVE